MASGTIPYIGKQFVDLGNINNLNIDNRQPETVYFARYYTNATNKPDSAAGSCFLFTQGSANYGAQIVINDVGFYIRKLSNTYRSWKTITTL